MAVTNLGRVGFVSQGAWSAGTYKHLDFVRHSNATWTCGVESTTGEPGVSADWDLSINDGSSVASGISNTPAGDIVATNVQAAINELDTEKTSLADLASTANGDGASLIGIEDSGTLITATTVEGALAEIATDVANILPTEVAVTDDDNKIPTSGAIVDYVTAKTTKEFVPITDPVAQLVTCTVAWADLVLTALSGVNATAAVLYFYKLAQVSGYDKKFYIRANGSSEVQSNNNAVISLFDTAGALPYGSSVSSTRTYPITNERVEASMNVTTGSDTFSVVVMGYWKEVAIG